MKLADFASLARLGIYDDIVVTQAEFDALVAEAKTAHPTTTEQIADDSALAEMLQRPGVAAVISSIAVRVRK